jgi:hypothetical protein
MPSDGGAGHVRAGDAPVVDPLEIFSALAAVCVPVFCDGVRFELLAESGSGVDVSYPADDPADHPHAAQSAHEPGNRCGNPDCDDPDGDHRDAAPTDGSRGGRIVVAVRGEPMAGEPAISGTVTCTWRDPARPTDADRLVARLLADQALAKVGIETLAGALQKQRIRSANLEEALATNREIGQAIGILMASEQLTAVQAFERLRTVSQHTHRKLREIAADVTETGVLAISPELARAQVRLGLAPSGQPDQRGERSKPRVQRRTRSGQAWQAAPTPASGTAAE